MEIETIGIFRFTKAQREKFYTGELRDRWAKQYPMLFDEDDIRITQDQKTYHFFEWLAAVLLYNSCGYHSLIEKYEFKSHPRKQQILQKLVSPEISKLISDHTVQCPDLLVYSQDMKDWFFSEVKGLNDYLRDTQKEYFSKLSELSGKPVRLIEFKEMNS